MIIFSRIVDQVQEVCHMQQYQLLYIKSYMPLTLSFIEVLMQKAFVLHNYLALSRLYNNIWLVCSQVDLACCVQKIILICFFL